MAKKQPKDQAEEIAIVTDSKPTASDDIQKFLPAGLTVKEQVHTLELWIPKEVDEFLIGKLDNREVTAYCPDEKTTVTKPRFILDITHPGLFPVGATVILPSQYAIRDKVQKVDLGSLVFCQYKGDTDKMKDGKAIKGWNVAVLQE